MYPDEDGVRGGSMRGKVCDRGDRRRGEREQRPKEASMLTLQVGSHEHTGSRAALLRRALRGW